MIDHFAPISLDALTARASLLTRVDRKYLLPATSLPGLLAALPADTRVLEIAGRRGFAYRSAYFDTPDLISFRASARRRRRRFKLRIRSYLDAGQDFLEVKTRGARGVTIKTRLPYAGSPTHPDPTALLAEAGVEPVGSPFVPSLVTRYERVTLFLPSTGSRLTVDRALTWTLPDGPGFHLPERIIVETKSERATSPVDRLLWSLSHRPCSISKYATGLAALRPDLPANRWHRVLQNHFAGAVPITQPDHPPGRAVFRPPVPARSAVPAADPAPVLPAGRAVFHPPVPDRSAGADLGASASALPTAGLPGCAPLRDVTSGSGIPGASEPLTAVVIPAVERVDHESS